MGGPHDKQRCARKSGLCRSHARAAASCLTTVLALACSPEPLPSVPVQRLTNSEYVAAVEALFSPVELELSPAMLPSAVDVDGFDNNVDLSAAYPSVVESYRLLALEVSARVWQALPEASGCAPSERDCIESWLTELGERVSWRSQAGARVAEAFSRWERKHGLEQATQLSVQLLLLSPEFSYAPRSGNVGAGALEALPERPLARRLAFFMWNAPPDAELLAAADSGELASAEGLRAQAMRMLGDVRAQRGVLRFYEQLLEWERVRAANVDPEFYLLESPSVGSDEVIEHTEEFAGEYLRFRLQPAMQAEAELFVTHHLFAGEGTLAALLTSSESFTTWDLGELVYGVAVDQSQTPARILPGPVEGLEYPVYAMSHDPAQRAGLLTQANFLHQNAGPVYPSPVHRGVFVMERLLCQPPAAPPEDVPPLQDSSEGGTEPQTNRERFAEHTQNPACQSCHQQIDAIGFTFEHYDSLGVWRDEDAGVPVDASGALLGTDQDGPLSDALELSNALAGSRSVHDCHVLNWFRYAFGRSEAELDEDLLAQLQAEFWDNGGDVQALLLALVSSEAFRAWRPSS